MKYLPLLYLLSSCIQLTGPTRPGDTLTEQEATQLREVAALVASCQPVQGFPFIPCVEGDPLAAVPGLITDIRVVHKDGHFICNNMRAVGCWKQSTKTLTYITGNMGALEHELLHALLWAVDDDRHVCSLHFTDGIWDCYK